MGDESKKSDKKIKSVTVEGGEPSRGMKILASMKVTKDDFVNIAVAKRERDLLEQRQGFDTEIKKVRAEIDETNGKLAKKAKELVEGEFKPQMQAAVAALQAAGFSSATSELSFTNDGAAQKVNFTLGIRTDDGRHNSGGFNRTGKKDYTEEMTKLSEMVDLLTKKLTKAQEDSMSCRRELGNLATTERQAKAALAARVLELSEDGAGMLEALDDVKQLPLSM